MTTELYKKHRPRKMSQVIGQDSVCKMLTDMVKRKELPHSLLLHGPSGTGKTTIARILRAGLKCSKTDFIEMNSANARGIDMVRDISNKMKMAPLGGQSRIWMIDEAHQLSKDAQNAFLKILEDTPSHVYFFLATTDPQKLIKTVRTRCTDIPLTSLKPSEITELVEGIASQENINLASEVSLQISVVAEGSPRKALVLLDSISHVPEDQQLDLVLAADVERQAIEIARTLIKPRAKWSDVAKLLKEVKEDPESIRWMILGYANTIMLGGGKLTPKAALIIEVFSENFYDSKKAGLTAACYEVLKNMDQK